MKVTKQIEPNYTQSRNGGAEFSECIFQTADGRLFKGRRSAEESPRTARRKFLTWLSGNSEDRHEFIEVESIAWNFNAAFTVAFDSNGKRID